MEHTLRVLVTDDEAGMREGAARALGRYATRIEELELLDQAVVEPHRHIGWQSQGIDPEVVERGFKGIACLQQIGPFGIDVLPQVVDLDERDQAAGRLRSVALICRRWIVLGAGIGARDSPTLHP